MYRLRTDEELDKILKKKQKRARKRREKWEGMYVM